MSALAGFAVGAALTGGAWYLTKSMGRSDEHVPARVDFERLHYDIRGERKRYGLYTWNRGSAPVLMAVSDSLDALEAKGAEWLAANPADRAELGVWDSRRNRVAATFRITWRATTMPNPVGKDPNLFEYGDLRGPDALQAWAKDAEGLLRLQLCEGPFYLFSTKVLTDAVAWELDLEWDSMPVERKVVSRRVRAILDRLEAEGKIVHVPGGGGGDVWSRAY
jgi:hypothetical protein